MKKIIFNCIFIIILLFLLFISVLSTVGIKTDKFNTFITDKAFQAKNVELELNDIKFKLDYKEISLFLETEKPKINYKNNLIPAQSVKVYIDFLSLLKSELKIRKISFALKELDIAELNNLSAIIKPSNFKSLLNNKIKKGKLISEIEIFLNNQGDLENFIARGKVKGLKLELTNDVNITEVNLDFFGDKSDILIKNIFGNLSNINISNGDIKINLDDGIKLESNFNSKFDLDKNFFKKHTKEISKLKLKNNLQKIKGNLINNLYINLDNTYKVKDYDYNISGKLEEGKLILPELIKNNIIEDDFKSIYFTGLQIKTHLKPKTLFFKGDGKYSLNNSDYLEINFENKFKEDQKNFNINFDFKNNLKLDLINYKKPKNSIANISLIVNEKKEEIKVNELKYLENDNSIKIDNLIFKENKFLSFEKIEIKTPDNDFFIANNKKILAKGSKFDGTNLVKFLSKEGRENKFKRINSNIEIDFKNIKIPMAKKLKNFKLIGEIKKGQFTKISSKGDFGGGNFLDISMKKDKNSNKKYLEIYSDLTRPLLTEYSFFKGLSGGNLLFTSIIDQKKNYSKLKIENFKVVNAPGMIKLLSLADLGGLADIVEGEGLSFDTLEIDMEKNKDFLKINEILALGPSVSVLMEGYQDANGITSLRGTLVPAKTLNKLISKIPLIGNIVVPKEVGEGLFGISFKMKGPKNNIKTTINPIRTLTPRFIQKIIDKNKTN